MAVEVVDVEDKLGRSLTGIDAFRVQTDIDEAYALAEARGLLSEPETAAQSFVIRRVVLRAFRNPEGERLVGQESLGSRSVSYVANDERPGVYFTPQDVADMQPGRVRAVSVGMLSHTEPW